MPDDMPDEIRRLSTRIAYQNQWLTVREDEIEYAAGGTGTYSVVEKRDFAVVLPYENGGFWLVEQFRYPTGRREWEFPQGGWPDGKDGTARDLAAAELREETGLRAGQLDHLGRLNSAPGYAVNGFDVFLATELTAGAPQREISEADMVHAFVPEATVHDMIRAGEFRDSNGVAALTLLALWRAGH